MAERYIAVYACKMYLFLMLLAISSVLATSQSTRPGNETDRIPCTLSLNKRSKEEHATLIKTAKNEKYDVIHLKIDVVNMEVFDKLFPMSSGDKESLLTWIAVTVEGKEFLKHMPNYKGPIFQLMSRGQEISYTLQVNVSTFDCIVPDEMREFDIVLGYIHNALDDVFKNNTRFKEVCHQLSPREPIFMGLKTTDENPSYVCYDVSCDVTEIENCKTVLKDAFLVQFTYFWTYFMILYSPYFVYILYDWLHIRDENHKFYHAKDRPYGVMRIFIVVSCFMLSFVPKSKRRLNARPLVRTALLIWVLNVGIQFINGALYFTVKGNGYMYKGIILLAEVPFESRLLIVGAVLILLLLLTVVILQTWGHGDHKQGSFVYAWSTSGTFRSIFMKRTLSTLYINVQKQKLKEGQYYTTISAERFELLFHSSLWKWILQEAFSILLKKRKSVIKYILYFIPGLLCGSLCFVLSAILNLLWGLFPLIGIFLFFLTSVKSWLDLFRVILVFIFILLFLQLLVISNIIFVLNVTIYTVFHILPANEDTTVPIVAKAIVFICYLILYWHQFVTKYSDLLAVLFEVENELSGKSNNISLQDKEQSHEEVEKNDEKTEQGNNVQRISIKEFEFVSNHCVPVQKKIMALMFKTLLTGTFLLVTFTVLFLKGKLSGHSGIGKTLAFLLISVLPKLLENAVKRSKIETDEDELKQRMIIAVQTWKEKLQTLQELQSEEGDIVSRDVECTVSTCCYRKRNNGDSATTAIEVTRETVQLSEKSESQNPEADKKSSTLTF